MTRKITAEEEIIRREQPLNWARAFLAGMAGVILMMSFIDCFAMLGLIPFSFENYLGVLIRASDEGTHNWTVGFFANLIVGGLFGFVYAYVFENTVRTATSGYGVKLGFLHCLFAGLLVFPFFQVMHAEVGTQSYREFGFLGSGMSPALPLVLLVGHLLYGATMGTLYGSVGINRLRERIAEPGRSPDSHDELDEAAWHEAA